MHFLKTHYFKTKLITLFKKDKSRSFIFILSYNKMLKDSVFSPYKLPPVMYAHLTINKRQRYIKHVWKKNRLVGVLGGIGVHFGEFYFV